MCLLEKKNTKMYVIRMRNYAILKYYIKKKRKERTMTHEWNKDAGYDSL